MRNLLGTCNAASAILLACLALPIQAAQDVDGTPIKVTGEEVPVDVPATYYTKLHSCPKACSAKKSPEDWTLYSSVERLELCDWPMLVDFAVFNPLDDPATGIMLKACTLGNDDHNALGDPTLNHTTKSAIAATPKSRRDMGSASTPACLHIGNATTANFELLWDDGSSRGADATSDLLALLQGVEKAFQEDNGTFCDRSSLFGYANGAAIGVYVGNTFGKATVASTIESLISEIKQDGGSLAAVVAQLCSSSGSGRDPNQAVVGVSINTIGIKSLARVQLDVVSWAQGKCTTGLNGAKSQLAGVHIWENTAGLLGSSNSSSNRTHVPLAHGHSAHRLQRRGDCTTATVASGDSCGSMAVKCGISGNSFMTYNPTPNFCSTLMPNQKVCCSAGTIPTPKQNADGSCFKYHIQPGDTCSAIALSNGLTVTKVENFNLGKTWGWTSCTNIQAGLNICLSAGTAPLPAPYDNAVCGPVVPGTTYPPSGTNITDLNPCPLNACCDVWGQCVCTKYSSPTGNPGYSPPGQSGCISNCGDTIPSKGTPPAAFQRVGYWEAWNFDRPCLNLRVANANTDGSYTHIHWAFGTIDSGFNPQINDTYNQWPDFTQMTGVKRIISFGGWGYSTSPATYDVLRQAMSPVNRQTFAANIVKFLNTNNLDGVDFDWEYPGAPDIPGIPPGQVTDGLNYLKFLATLKGQLPSGKTMSIAAPASYWYLKAFPIAKMAIYLDYIVYMTYDLHGQWDYGNKWAVEGCPGGNCLRSHVNMTETVEVLAMIIKAGVPNNKIFVGESSYGRSFGMSNPSCAGPMCTYTGGYDVSTAEPGLCTQTAGYISNAEIYTLLDLANNAITWYDNDSASDIMTWDNGQWVAFMSANTKTLRRAIWQNFNFAGTVDWAVDLQNYGDEGDPSGGGGDDDYLPPGDIGWGACSATYSSLEAIDADSGIPFHCSALYVLQFLQANLTASMSSYDSLMSNGYDGKFNEYADVVVRGSAKEVDDFMRANGNKYFTCVVTESTLCCSKCSQQAPGAPGGCTYCFNGDCCVSQTGSKLKRGTLDRPPPPTNGCGVLSIIKVEYMNMSEPCPPDYSKRGLGQGDPIADTVYWTLQPSQSNQFYADLYSATGISQDHIALKDINHSECTPSDSWQTCRNTNWDIGVPSPNGYDQSDVLNPKDTVSKAYNNLQNLKGNAFNDVITQVSNNQYPGDPMDLVDALAMPIFMISDAIDGMNQVVSIANEIDHAKMLEIIFGFLTAIFFFIPIAGEIAGQVTALAGIARIASLIGAAGNAAMDIYQVVDAQGNAPLAIFDLITAPLALADIAAIAKAAGIRRGMNPQDLESLGKVKAKLDIIEHIKTKGICSASKKRDLEDMGLLEGPSRSSVPRIAMSMSELNGRGGMVSHYEMAGFAS